jgi:hypothetical protein
MREKDLGFGIWDLVFAVSRGRKTDAATRRNGDTATPNPQSRTPNPQP